MCVAPTVGGRSSLCPWVIPTVAARGLHPRLAYRHRYAIHVVFHDFRGLQPRLGACHRNAVHMVFHDFRGFRDAI